MLRGAVNISVKIAKDFTKTKPDNESILKFFYMINGLIAIDNLNDKYVKKIDKNREIEFAYKNIKNLLSHFSPNVFYKDIIRIKYNRPINIKKRTESSPFNFYLNFKSYTYDKIKKELCNFNIDDAFVVNDSVEVYGNSFFFKTFRRLEEVDPYKIQNMKIQDFILESIMYITSQKKEQISDILYLYFENNFKVSLIKKLSEKYLIDVIDFVIETFKKNSKYIQFLIEKVIEENPKDVFFYKKEDFENKILDKHKNKEVEFNSYEMFLSVDSIILFRDKSKFFLQTTFNIVHSADVMIVDNEYPVYELKTENGLKMLITFCLDYGKNQAFLCMVNKLNDKTYFVEEAFK